MKVLLDTNVFLRWTGEESVPRRVERLIMSETNTLLVSIVTPWEIAIKQPRWRDNKLSNARVRTALDLLGARILPILLKHIDVLSSLPEHHADPFDRMLIAQAISEDAVVLSRDERFPLYKTAGLQIRWD